ncbi:MAG: Arm DNA-binding domain-containing protein [Achromobacter sp.]|uniref:Arm DNA-binding domain-containing protein n=1 Tax=Achromobacter sp. TaxID=134375 RepID=UPI003CFCE408
MQFDARAAKLLEPGRHLTIDGYPGLRLEATATARIWIYRYKSPVSGNMRQKKLGRWPAMSIAAAVVEWEILRHKRDAGMDVAVEARQERQALKVAAAAAKVKAKGLLTVADACDIYLTGHIKQHRAEKGLIEIKRTFKTMWGTLRASLQRRSLVRMRFVSSNRSPTFLYSRRSFAVNWGRRGTIAMTGTGGRVGGCVKLKRTYQSG